MVRDIHLPTLGHRPADAGPPNAFDAFLPERDYVTFEYWLSQIRLLTVCRL